MNTADHAQIVGVALYLGLVAAAMVIPLQATVRRMQLSCSALMLAGVFTMLSAVAFSPATCLWAVACWLPARLALVALNRWEKQTEYTGEKRED